VAVVALEQPAGGDRDVCVRAIGAGEEVGDLRAQRDGACGGRLVRRMRDVVGDAAVDLVAHPGEHGHREPGDGARHAFGVERREVDA
jgi:hypothetical protein